MVSRRSASGPTGHPGRHVEDTWAALTSATVPTKLEGATVVAGGSVLVVVGASVLVGEPATGARKWGPATRGLLEHAASRAQGRRPVTRRTARWRPGRGTTGHPSPLVVALGFGALAALV